MTKYSNTEFRIVAWDKKNPLPTKPQKLALYVVKDGLKFEMYFTDSMGNYLNNGAPTSTIEKTSDILLNDGEDGTSRYVEEKELGDAAYLDVGTGAGDVAAGDDVRIIAGAEAYTWGDHADEGYSKQTLVAGDNIDITGDVIKAILPTAPEALFQNDIPVVLNDGKTIGKYRNGQTIPAIGKTAEEVITDIAQEYLTPKITAFSISGQSVNVEVGTVITGSKSFVFNITNSHNLKPNPITITDTTNSQVLGDNLPSSSPAVLDVLGPITKTTATRNRWTITAEPTQGGNITRTTDVNWKYGYFFGQSDTDVTTSSQVRAFPLVTDVQQGATTTANVGLDDGGTFKFHVNLVPGKSDFYLFIKEGRVVSYVSDFSALNGDVTSGYVLDGTLTIKDAGGNDQVYNKYKYIIGGGYGSKHQHDVTIING